MKVVKYKGLEITGDPNVIDELIYGKGKEDFIVKETDVYSIIGDIFQFNKRFIPERHNMTPKELTEWIKQFIVCIQDELSELLGEIPWKHWKDYSDFDFDDDKILGELADILIFTFGIVGILGYSPERIFEEIAKKTEVNNRRQEEGY